MAGSNFNLIIFLTGFRTYHLDACFYGTCPPVYQIGIGFLCPKPITIWSLFPMDIANKKSNLLQHNHMEAYWKIWKYWKEVSPPIQRQVLNEYFVMEV
jgi:hypothetical protein